jgi:hypothetical protein
MRGFTILALCTALAAPAMAQDALLTSESSTATGDGEGGRELSVEGVNGASLSAFVLDPDGNGIVDDAEETEARQFAVTAGECEGLIVSSSNAEQIMAITETASITLTLVCADPDGLPPDQRAAIAGNSALMNKLANAGYGLGDVAGVELDASGSGTLYLSTN